MIETKQRPRTRREHPIRVRPTFAHPRVHVVSEAEGKAMFDDEARHELGISGEEFLRRYDAGEFHDVTDMDRIHKINRVIMMIPFVRRVPA